MDYFFDNKAGRRKCGESELKDEKKIELKAYKRK